jgi:hypothetical protein
VITGEEHKTKVSANKYMWSIYFMSRQSNFMVFGYFYKMTESLSITDKGNLYDAMFLYNLGKPLPEMDEALTVIFDSFKLQFDSSRERYEKAVEDNKLEKAKQDHNLYTEGFNSFLSEYPVRKGVNHKAKAYRRWNRRLSEHTEHEIIGGAKRYKLFCDMQEKTGTEHVMEVARFLGGDKPFKGAWSIQDLSLELDFRAL